MKFLLVRSDVCRQLPSDFTLRWTPLLLAMQFPLLGLARDFHPLDNAHAERTKKTPATVEVWEFFYIGIREQYYHFFTSPPLPSTPGAEQFLHFSKVKTPLFLHFSKVKHVIKSGARKNQEKRWESVGFLIFGGLWRRTKGDEEGTGWDGGTLPNRNLWGGKGLDRFGRMGMVTNVWIRYWWVVSCEWGTCDFWWMTKIVVFCGEMRSKKRLFVY